MQQILERNGHEPVVFDEIPTRRSLLSRLKDRADQEGWRMFFETYWRLIYNAAIRAGLTDSEAQETVQETVLSVLKSMPTFEYDPARGSFKGWLMRLTGWRITDQLRRRMHGQQRLQSLDTAVIDHLPDSTSFDLETIWEKEWEANLLEAAVERVKRKVDAKHYQIFDLYARQGWKVGRVAKALNVTSGRVYLTKHRVGLLVMQEIAHLKKQLV